MTRRTPTEWTLGRLGVLAAKGRIPKAVATAIGVIATVFYRGSICVDNGAWRWTVHEVWLDSRLGWRATLINPNDYCYGFGTEVIQFWKGRVYVMRSDFYEKA